MKYGAFGDASPNSYVNTKILSDTPKKLKSIKKVPKFFSGYNIYFHNKPQGLSSGGSLSLESMLLSRS